MEHFSIPQQHKTLCPSVLHWEIDKTSKSMFDLREYRRCLCFCVFYCERRRAKETSQQSKSLSTSIWDFETARCFVSYRFFLCDLQNEKCSLSTKQSIPVTDEPVRSDLNTFWQVVSHSVQKVQTINFTHISNRLQNFCSEF